MWYRGMATLIRVNNGNGTLTLRLMPAKRQSLGKRGLAGTHRRPVNHITRL